MLHPVVKFGLALNAGTYATGMTINLALDRQLAKSANPGKINRYFRRSLRSGRRYSWICSVISMAYFVASANEFKKISQASAQPAV